VEWCQSGSCRGEEMTYLGMVLNLSANSPSLDGHASAKPWYVTRPSSRASAERASSSLNLSPSSPRLISKLQPPCLKLSAPPGSSMTPSSDTNSDTTILPTLILLLVDGRSGVPRCARFWHASPEGEATVNELAEPFPISVQPVS